MTDPLPPGTRVRITWEPSGFAGREGVIVKRVGDQYRVHVGGGGAFLRAGEFEVLPATDRDDDEVPHP